MYTCKCTLQYSLRFLLFKLHDFQRTLQNGHEGKAGVSGSGCTGHIHIHVTSKVSKGFRFLRLIRTIINLILTFDLCLADASIKSLIVSV